MSDYKGNSSKSGSNNENDSDSCNDIYSELPKEVVDMLKKTHPLMAKEGNKANNDNQNENNVNDENPEEFSRIPSLPSSRGDDVFEVREARMQKVGDEIEEIKKHPQMEGDPTKFVTRRDASEGLESINVVIRTPKEVKKMNGEDEQHENQKNENDGIEFVSVVPARNKFNDRDAVSYPTSRVSGQTAEGGSSSSKKKRKMQGDNNMKNQKVHYDDIDFEEREKQEQLDNLYDDGYYEDDVMFSGREKTFTIAFGVGIVAILFLSFRLASLSTALEKAEMDLANSLEMNSKYEELQLQNMNLQEQLSDLLPSGGATSESSGDATTDGSESAPVVEGDLGSITVYTVVDGDNGWSIAQKVYGNGSRFPEILEANGLKESDTIRVGTELKIPR